MKGLTKTTLWEFLELMRDRTRDNIMLIKHNNSLILEIEKQLYEKIVNDPNRIIELRKRNKELSQENHELLELHKNIISLGEKYGLYSSNDLINEKDDDKEERNEPINKSNALIAELDFNNIGKWINSCNNLEEIYETLLNEERYEDCAKLKTYLSKHNDSDIEIHKSIIDKIKFWKK